MSFLKSDVSGRIASAIVGAIIALLVVSIARGCASPDDTVAYVNGTPVSVREYQEYIQNKKTVAVQLRNGVYALPVAAPLGYQAALDLVDQELELQMAKDKGLVPSDSDIEKEVQFRLREDPSFLLNLESEGLTTDVIKKEVAVDIAVDRLLTQGVRETADDARAYMKAHPKEFLAPPSVDLSYIYVKKKADISKVTGELASGMTFMHVALEYSSDPNALNYHGKYFDPSKPIPTIAGLPANVQSALVGLGDKGTSKWIPYNGGYAVFHVDKIYPAKPMSLNADGMESLRRNLARIQGEKKHNLANMIKEQAASSKIRFDNDSFEDLWKSSYNS